ncbi:MAG: methionine--tRNA ligase subunit beta [Pseudomonadota bacterium]|nr:methionine--tRNA ligase subunit beta [Pseudomonadota bacterium]
MAEEKITIEDFIKIDLRVGKILHAEEVEDSRKMLKLDVDIGEEKRTIYAGVKKSYAPEELINKLVIVIVNLLPREMKFGTSDGMMLATQSDGEIVVLQPEKEVIPGSKVS